MKVGIFSDVHGNHAALAAVAAGLRDCDGGLFFLGDLFGYYSFVNACAEHLNSRAIGVLGNHDAVAKELLSSPALQLPEYEKKYGSALRRACAEASPRALELLSQLPAERITELNGITFALFHGAPWDPLEGRVYPDFRDWQRFDSVPADVILLGHTHYPLLKRWRNKLILNPGSIGQARDNSGYACFATLDLHSMEICQHRVPYSTRVLDEDSKKHDPGLPYLVEVLSR